MPSVIGKPSFSPRTTLAWSGPARPSVTTNSPDSLRSLLMPFRTAMWASISFLDHALYVSTPAFVPVIIKMYFMFSAPSVHFALVLLRLHSGVGARDLVSTCWTRNFQESRFLRHVYCAHRESTYGWRF